MFLAFRLILGFFLLISVTAVTCLSGFCLDDTDYNSKSDSNSDSKSAPILSDLESPGLKPQPISVDEKEDNSPHREDLPSEPDFSVDRSNLSETQSQYLGNKFSQKYHLKGCYFARIARPENIFLFATCKEAIKSKYRPCNWCLPKWQKFVKGRILDSSGNFPKQNADAKKSPSQ